MSLPLILGCLWVIAAAVTALLPMRRQYAPGITLLASGPLLIGWIGWEHGLWWGIAGGFALLSMFRRPLIYFVRRAVGMPAPVPADLDATSERDLA